MIEGVIMLGYIIPIGILVALFVIVAILLLTGKDDRDDE